MASSLCLAKKEKHAELGHADPNLQYPLLYKSLVGFPLGTSLFSALHACDAQLWPGAGLTFLNIDRFLPLKVKVCPNRSPASIKKFFSKF